VNKQKGINILLLELVSEDHFDFESMFKDLNCDQLFIKNALEEFNESLLYEPIDLVLIHASLAQNILANKAVSSCNAHQIPIALITDDELEIAGVKRFTVKEEIDQLQQFVEKLGFKSFSISRHTLYEKDENLIEDSIFVKSNQQYKRILFKDILFIKSDHVYLEIHTQNERYIVRASFKEYADKLPSKNFYRVHKSFMINVEHIELINQNDVVINKVHIPISRELKAFITKSIKT